MCTAYKKLKFRIQMMHIYCTIDYFFYSFSGGIDHIFRYKINKYNFLPRHETVCLYILKNNLV